MKANHIPVDKRLQERIYKLEARLEASRGKKKGNPYLYCKECGVHDPELSNRGGRDTLGACSMQGLRKEIDHYVSLLGSAILSLRCNERNAGSKSRDQGEARSAESSET